VADVFTKRKRSEVMAQIRGRGNKGTELALAKLFRAHSISGWRRQGVIRMAGGKRQGVGDGRRDRPTRPTNIRTDFIFTRQRVAVFVDGCFWHGCRWHCTQPRQNAAFWRKKLAGNKARDRLVTRQLRRLGWTVVRIWEHELRTRLKDEGGGMKAVARVRTVLGR